jgi:hypothetical protein
MSDHNAEIAAMRAAYSALAPLSPQAQLRALAWLGGVLASECDSLPALARALLERAAQVPARERFRRLVESGLIDEDGRLTGVHLPEPTHE